MKKCTASSSCGPEATVKDALTELLRNGARDLIAKAVETELETLLGECSSLRLEDERAAIVRNGYLPGWTVTRVQNKFQTKLKHARKPLQQEPWMLIFKLFSK